MSDKLTSEGLRFVLRWIERKYQGGKSAHVAINEIKSLLWSNQ